MTPEELLQKLGSEQALDELAAALVDDALATPVGALVSPPALANEIVEGLRAWLNSEVAHEAQLRWAGKARSWLRERAMTLGQLTGSDVEDAALDLAALPYVPSREILIFLLDREPMRLLLRELFMDSLLKFGNKLRASMIANPVAKGLGGLGRFARDRARSTMFGAFASDVAERLTDEVERQLEKRAAEFAEAALSGLAARLADLLSDPARAQQQASLREALVDGLFALQTSELADEMERSNPTKRSEIIRRGIGLWIASDDATKQIHDALVGLLEGYQDRPLGEVLSEAGLLEIYRELGIASVRRRLGPIIQGQAFRGWLEKHLA